MSRTPRSRRGFLGDVARGALAAALASAASCRRAGRPPSFWIVVADDLGIDAVGAYGSGLGATPVVDELARKGVRFEACYATPLCTPSRVELLTGKYPFRTGWTANIDHRAQGGDPQQRFVDPRLGSFARELRAAGYRTAVAGKWQLCHFEEHPDHVRRMGFESFCLWWWTVEGRARNRYWEPAIFRDGERIDRLARAYGPDVFFEHLAAFAREHREEPFLLFHPMVLPHKPYLLPPHRLPKGGVDHRASADPAKFPGMVEYMDRLVGRAVALLLEIGRLDDTYLLFLSDNGTPDDVTVPFRGRTSPGEKGRLTERGCHVPLVAFGGGLEGPRSIEGPLDLADLHPTLLDLAGLDPPPALDGRSFAAALRGEAGASTKGHAFSQLGALRAVRFDRWFFRSDGRLWDVVDDPFCERDLGRDPAHAPLLEEGMRRLRAIAD